MAEQKKVRIIVERQDGPKEKPYNQEFEIDYRPGLNIVAALMEIQKNPVTVDGKKVPPVTWECNCLEKVCGACMMVINGKARQACCTLVDTLKQPIHLQPARTFPVIRDLLIDRSVMFESLKRIHGWVEVDGTWEVKDAPIQNPYTAQTAYEISHCMTCGCCARGLPERRPAVRLHRTGSDGTGLPLQPPSARKVRRTEAPERPDGEGWHHELWQQPELRRSLPEEHQADDVPRTAQPRRQQAGSEEYLQSLITDH